jgi:hypothetical protein
MAQKRRNPEAGAWADATKGSNRKAWGRELPSSLLCGVIGGGSEELNTFFVPSETPPPLIRG